MASLAEDLDDLRSLFDMPVYPGTSVIGDHTNAAFAVELAAATNFAPRRRAEFVAGRAAARAALASAGVPPQAIPRRADRLPAWPEGFAGSITHCEGFCAAVVIEQHWALSLGLDAEPRGTVSAPEASIICNEAEFSAAVQHLHDYESLEVAKIIFCVKEAVFKCHFPVFQDFLEFLDVEIRFSLRSTRDSGHFELVSVRGAPLVPGLTLSGRWRATRTHLLAGACLTI